MIELKDTRKIARPTYRSAHGVYNGSAPPISRVIGLPAQRCHLVMTESMFSRTNIELRLWNNTLDVSSAPVRIIALVEDPDN
jgi:hypothetical protein